MSAIKIIKRYQNRKLYNTVSSAYITLEKMADMIKAGDDVRVIDNKTKNDITVSTLTQLLYEKERSLRSQPPVGLLREIISQGNGSYSGYIEAKFSTSSIQTDSQRTNSVLEF